MRGNIKLLIVTIYLGLSRNPAAFNRYTEDYYEDESDDDTYAEVEMLVNNPAEEHRLRLLNERRSNNSSQDEQPVTPNLVHSFYSQDDDELETTGHENEDKHEDFQPTAAYKTFKAIAFFLFMIYWIISEPIIRTMAFITMIFSAVIFNPIKHIWSKLSINEKRIQYLKKISPWFTLIAFGLCIIPISLFTKPYLYASLVYLIPQRRSSTELAELENTIKSIAADRFVIWSILEKIENQEIKNIWTRLDDHQLQINELKDSIDEKITLAMESKLPDLILVQINENGQLELSPRFYAYLQDSTLWDNFLEQNDESIKKYFSGEQKKTQGAIIGKDAFTKLLSNALIHHQHPISQGTEVSFDELINSAIQVYHQDVLNTADFALASRGAKVLKSLTSPTFHPLSNWMRSIRHFVGFDLHVNSPKVAITSGTHVGECWSMYGNNGNLTILLSEAITVQGITVEYPSAEIMMENMSTAPKEIEVYGFNDYHQSNNPTFLGKFTYDISKGSPIQTFDIVMNQSNTFRAVSINLRSNWGSQERTDIYRIRVHGTPD